MSDQGLTSWSSELTSRERVREIATTLSQPRSVEWIREEAQISSRLTAKDELEMLVDFGQLETIEGDDGCTKYAPNYQRRYFDELAELINDYTKAELREQIADIQGEIDAWQAEFDVESQKELEATLTAKELTSKEIRRRNTVIREWQQLKENKQLLQHALKLYQDARP